MGCWFGTINIKGGIIHGGQEIIRLGARIRQLFGVEDNGIDLGPYTLGNKRTLREYEKYAGIHFEKNVISTMDCGR